MRNSGIVSTILYILIGVVLAISINQGLAFALQTDMPVVAVESNSMVPTFYRGDILVLQGVADPNDYSSFLDVGDIIVFSPPTQEIPVVHRIIEINPDGTYRTKGDANSGQLSFEKSISKSQIRGKVITIVPYLGWVKIGMTEVIPPLLVQNITYVFILIIIISVIYFVYRLSFGEGTRRNKKR